MSNEASEQTSVSGATPTGPSTAGAGAPPSESPGPSATVTYTLIGLNVLAFVVMVISGVSFLSPTTESLLKWGANYGPLTLRGQWWRMFTSIFVHIGVMHVLFNMVVLANIGPFMETMLGGSGYTILYVAAGLGGGAASLALHPGTVSAGASGAIFGLYGGLLAFLMLHKSSIAKEVLFPLWKGAAVFIGYNLLYSLKPGVDMAAHVGGLAAGFIIGLFLVQPASAIAPARGTRNGVAALLGLAILIVPLVALPKPDDLIAEVNRMSAVEDKAVDLFNTSLNKWKANQLTDQQFLDVMEQQVLPKWKAERETMSKLKGLSKGQAELASSLVAYMGAREEGWSLLVDGVRTGDAEKIRKSAKKGDEADKLAMKIGAK